jgi:hypothetical protein
MIRKNVDFLAAVLLLAGVGFISTARNVVPVLPRSVHATINARTSGCQVLRTVLLPLYRAN